MFNGHVFPLDPKTVAVIVADCYGQTVDDLYSLRRWHPLPAARRVLYALVHDECRVSWGQTAVLTGRSRHSGGEVARMAGHADPYALELARQRLHGNGQQALF